MTYRSMREFMGFLQGQKLLKPVRHEVDIKLEVTEICRRMLCNNGPALLFENPRGHTIPLLGNLFGTKERVMAAISCRSNEELQGIGKMLAFLKEPGWPRELREVMDSLPVFRKVLYVNPKVKQSAACQENIIVAEDVDLAGLPVQTCWPGDVGPLITWGLVITRGPRKDRQNIGIYRQQVIGRNKVIMRWLPHRGGAMDFQEWQKDRPGEPFPVAVAIGADPATLIAAVAPIPDTLSEYQFAGLLRGARSEVAACRAVPLQVPASSELVLEGHIYPGEEAMEGPFGDHTGYYNSPAKFPVFTIECITHRDGPVYHSTYMGRSPYDEPSVLAMVLNEMFIPILQKQFPEIVDFYLPPEACSYRFAVMSIRKSYPGHARQVMLGIWSWLRQFTYTKFIVVTDDDIDVRDWKEVIWAISTRVDPARDTVLLERTPIDSLDFASPEPGLGSKMGIDATGKWPGETSREWEKPIVMSDEVSQRINQIWDQL